MRKVAAVLCVAVFSNSYAFGGMVEFSTGEFNVLAPDLVRLDVTFIGDVQANPDGIDFADIVIGSNDLPMTDFVFSDDWRAAFSQTSAIFNFGFVILSSTNALPVSVSAPLSLGTLTVDPTGLGLTGENEGDVLTVFVSFDDDFGTSQVGLGGQQLNPLSGVGLINVVPEPTTLSLLGLAALGLIRRRRKSA